VERGRKPRRARGARRRPVGALARAATAVPVLAALSLVLLPSAVAHAAPVASFTVSPAAPLTGDVVTFASTSTGGMALAWDLDADGQFNDGTGGTAQRAYATPGRYLVSLRVDGPDGSATQSQWVQVGNRPPVASFSYTPATPLAQDTVMFAASARDPDGSIASIGWDLNGDGIYTDASGPVASAVFPGAGAYPVAIAVTDNSGATTVASEGVAVAPRPPTMLSPFPIVRLTVRGTRRGVRVLRLGVQAPPGSRVAVRCIGRGCGKRSEVRLARTGRAVRFPGVQRRLRAGVVLEVRVTAPGRIGKYTRFRLRRGAPPRRVDLCLPPGAAGPAPCPAS
jgi:PKD domain-containing protein